MGSAIDRFNQSGCEDLFRVVMEVEDVFNVSIPYDEAERIRTTEDLVDLVTELSGLGSEAGQPCLSARAFFSLRSKLLDLLPLQRQEIRPSSRLESLIPKMERRWVWRTLRKDGIDLPMLQTSNTASILISLAAIAAAICWLSQYGLRQDLRLWDPRFWLSGALLFIGVTLMTTSHMPWATRIPTPYQTVRDVAIHLACGDVNGRQSGLLSREEVAHSVRMIVAEEYNAPMEGYDDSKELWRLA